MKIDSKLCNQILINHQMLWHNTITPLENEYFKESYCKQKEKVACKCQCAKSTDHKYKR